MARVCPLKPLDQQNSFRLLQGTLVMRKQEHEMRYPMEDQSQNAACDADQEPGNNRPYVTFSVAATTMRRETERITLFADDR
jgi:hypothetical protein